MVLVKSMDYLDPNKKKAHKIRLLVGYALFGVAIGLATLLLVFVANGYYVDRNTGEFIRNGLIFIDSKPGGAQVYVNGQKQRGVTDMRLVIPGDQNYAIDIVKDGYRGWSRELLLEGGSLRELTYARLIPEQLDSSPLLNLRSNPVSASQSVDKQWLVLGYAENPLALTLVNLDADPVAQQTITIPANLVTNPDSGILEVEEWADDNRFFLASYTVGESVEYLLIDSRSPEQTQNLSTLFASKSLEILLQDRKRDRFFVYNKETKILHTASISDGIKEEPYIDTPIIEYSNFGSDWTAYITESGEEGIVHARFKRGDQDILLKELKTDDKYFVELAKLGDDPIMAISSPIEDRAVVYLDPQKYIAENPDARIPVATTVLRVKDPRDIIISSDSSVVLAYGSENMASHEFDADRSYNFRLEVDLDAVQEPRWLDGQHLSVSSGGRQYTIDFDGSNVYDLVASMPTLGSFYSNSVEEMYTFIPAVTDGSGQITDPPKLVLTNLLIASDR